MDDLPIERVGRRIQRRLASLALGARQELRVLASSLGRRADLIRRLYERAGHCCVSRSQGVRERFLAGACQITRASSSKASASRAAGGTSVPRS